MNSLNKAIELTDQIAKGHKPCVMVSLSSREYRRRHVRLYRDTGGYYVRLGRRGMRKTYLAAMAGARIVSASIPLVVFYEV